MHRIFTFVVLIVTCSLIAGCGRGESSDDASGSDSLDLATVPGMVTTDVSMLVSDSGVLRYHAMAPIWYRYNLDKQEPYWYFPEGIKLDQLNDSLTTIGSIECDTAYNYERKQLWHLIGHVHVCNDQGEDFKTEELFWDMRAHNVYSDSAIRIERKRDILEGYGFTSNEQFTKYEIRQTTGIFEVRSTGERGDYEGDAPDDGEHLVENDEPGTKSDIVDTLNTRNQSHQERANAARQRHARGSQPSASQR